MADEKEENIGSFYMGRVRPPPEPKRSLPPGVLTVIALAALGGIIWYAYPRGAEKYTNVDVPLVKADTAPIKAVPANPGGMEVSHQDSTAFDPLQKNGGQEVEKLMPTPEQPLDKDQAIKEEDVKPVASSPALPPKLDMQMKETGNGTEEIVPKAEPVKTEPAKTAPVKTASAAPPAKAEADSQDEADDQATDKPAAADTQYEVQLGSYHEMTDAKKDWDHFQKKYPPYFSKLKMRLVKVDIPAKGTYYRLQAGVVSKDRAHAICDALKADKKGCILAKK